MGRLFNNANTTYKYIESAGFSHLSNDTLRMELTQLYEGGFSNILRQQEMEYRLKDEELHVI